MCGIIGAAGDVQKDVADAVQDMLIIDQLRGLDGTGVFTVGKYSGDKIMYKMAVDASTYVTTKRGNSIISPTKSVIIGHNRAATRGVLSHENSHPFQHGTITGVHNGTLVSTTNLPDHKMFDVDSDNLYYAIDKLGVDKAIELANGAYALVWWDDEDGSVNLLRNSQRPLYYAYTEGGKCLLWASEAWMIVAACGRRNVKLMEGFPKQLPEMQLLSVKVDKDVLKETTWRQLKEYSNIVSWSGNNKKPVLERDKYMGKRVRVCLKDYRHGCFQGFLVEDTSISVSMYVPQVDKAVFDDLDMHMGDIEASVSGVSHSEAILYLSYNGYTKLEDTSFSKVDGTCACCGSPFVDLNDKIPLVGYPDEFICEQCDTSQVLLPANKH